MTDIRVILISDEKPIIMDKNDIYSFIDPSQELTGAIYAEAAAAQQQHIGEYCNEIPTMPELLIKKAVDISKINMAELVAPCEGYNYVLPIIASFTGGRGRRIIRPPALSVAIKGCAVVFNEATRAMRGKERSCVAGDEIADISGLIVEALPRIPSVIGAAYLRFRTYGPVGIGADELTLLLRYLNSTREFASSVFSSFMGLLYKERLGVPPLIMPDIIIAPYSPVMAPLSFVRMFAKQSDVYNSGLLRLLFLEKEYGLADKRVQRLIDQFVSVHKVEESARERITSRVKKWYDETAVIKIIEDKFGAAKLKEVMAVARLQRIPIIKALPPKEAATVMAEKTARDQYLEAHLLNKCPHVRLARLFARTKSHNIMMDLLKYAGERKPGAYIKCKECHFNLLCPHTEIYYGLASRPLMEVRAAMEPFIAFRARNQFFCKICGEVIQVIELEDSLETRIAQDSMDEELRRKITAEGFSLLRYLTFSVAIVTRDFVFSAVDSVYPLVQETERQINKSRVSSTDENSAKSKLFICIYLWAHYLNVILRNPIVSVRDFRVARNSRDFVVELILAITNIIAVSKNTIINQIKNVTAQVIKTKLIDAYRLLAGAADYLISIPRMEGFIATGGIYNFMALAHFLHSKNKLFKHESIKATEAVLGKLGTQEVFYNAPIVALRATTYDKGRLINASAAGDANIFLRSYELMMGIVKHKKYYLYDNVGTNENILMRHSIPFAALLQKKRVCEEKNAPIHLARRIRSARHFGAIKHSPRSAFRLMPLGRLYDATGQPHKWVWGKCIICGATITAADAIDGQVILDVIRRNNRIANFFLFFENKCPAAPSALHVLRDGKCSVCGLGEMSREDYYEKYNTIFDKEYIAASRVTIPLAAPQVEILHQPISWTYDFSKILAFCEKAKINRWLILSMGAAEKIPRATILNGEYIAPEIFERTHTRVYVLSSYIRSLLLFYEQIKNYFIIAGQSQDVVKFITTYPIIEDQVKSLG